MPFQVRGATKVDSFLRSLKTSMGMRNYNTFLCRLCSSLSIPSTTSRLTSLMLLKESKTQIHPQINVIIDTGYQGLQKLHAQT